jgi:hypothetical protein
MDVWMWEVAMVNTGGSQCQETRLPVCCVWLRAHKTRANGHLHGLSQSVLVHSLTQLHGSQQQTADDTPTSFQCFYLRLASQLLFATSSADGSRCSISSCHLGANPVAL